MSVPLVGAVAHRYGVEMPITEGMYEVIVHGRPAVDAYRDLMRRKVGREVRPA
jgi:glycerol-3-phosphate dehydrogenase